MVSTKEHQTWAPSAWPSGIETNSPQNCLYQSFLKTVAHYRKPLHIGRAQIQLNMSVFENKSLSHLGLAGLKTSIGGERTEYTKLMAESREQALARLADQAQMMGANAILSVRFSTSTVVLGGVAELLANGTAAKLSD